MLSPVIHSDALWCPVMHNDVMRSTVMSCVMHRKLYDAGNTVWCTVIHYDILWCTMTSCDALWSHVIHYDVMWCTVHYMMPGDTVWCIVIHYSMLPCDTLWCHVMHWTPCEALWCTVSYMNDTLYLDTLTRRSLSTRFTVWKQMYLSHSHSSKPWTVKDGHSRRGEGGGTRKRERKRKTI